MEKIFLTSFVDMTMQLTTRRGAAQLYRAATYSFFVTMGHCSGKSRSFEEVPSF